MKRLNPQLLVVCLKRCQQRVQIISADSFLVSYDWNCRERDQGQRCLEQLRKDSALPFSISFLFSSGGTLIAMRKFTALTQSLFTPLGR